MTRLSHFMLAALPLTLLACDWERDRQDDEGEGFMPHCEETASAIELSEVRFGVLGADFAAAVPAQLDGAADFEGLDSSALSIDLVVDESSLRFIESTEAVPDTTGPVATIAVFCMDRMELDAELTMVSEDGQIDERIDVVLAIEDDGTDEPTPLYMDFRVELDADALGGSLSLEDYTDPGSFDSIRLFLAGGIFEGAFEGDLSAMGEETHGQVVSAMNIPVAMLSAVIAD